MQRLYGLAVLLILVLGMTSQDSGRIAELEERVVTLEERVGALEAAAESTAAALKDLAPLVEEARDHEAAKCHANQRTLEAAVAMYIARANNPEHRAPSTLDELVRAGLLSSIPTCPRDGASYVIHESGVVSCPHAEHARKF